jgi:type I restriction enzyme R subunit
MSAKEAKARIKINKLLEDSGWRFFDSLDGQSNIALKTKRQAHANAGRRFGQ